jgi:hypothetical protein
LTGAVRAVRFPCATGFFDVCVAEEVMGRFRGTKAAILSIVR